MPGALAPLGEAFRPLVSQVMDRLGRTPDERSVGRIVRWLDLLATWNAKVDLTAARGPEELVDLMLADAIVLARHEARGAKVVDVGSGAGGPGLALGLLRPDLALTLVEPLAKRVSFLRTVIGHLGGPVSEGGGSLRVVRGKVEELPDLGAAFGSAVARATFAPSAWIPIGAGLIAPGGTVWVLLARESPPDADGWDIDVDERYHLPLTGVERRALRYRQRLASP